MNIEENSCYKNFISRSRSSSPAAGEKKPATRAMSLRSKTTTPTRPESSGDLKRAASLRKQTSKPELNRTKSVGPASPSKTGGKSDRKKKEEKEAQTGPSSLTRNNSATSKKTSPPVSAKPKAEPKAEPLKKKSLGRPEVKKVPPPVAPKPGQRRLNLNLPRDLPTSKSKVTKQ